MKFIKPLLLSATIAVSCPGAVSAQTQIYNWVTIAGRAPGSTDGTNSAARFFHPYGVAVDTAGCIYVADRDNNTIRKLTPVGTDWVSSTIAGLAGTYGSADGSNSEARFWYPSGIAVGSDGSVYVAEGDLRKLTLVGTNWVSSTIAMWGVDAVAVDGAGNLFVANQLNHSISKLVPVGTNWVTSTLAGLAGTIGSADGTNSDARFSYPSGVAVDSGGIVYVADNNNRTIRKLTPMGTNWVTTTIAGMAGNGGSADGTSGDARFGNPQGIAMGNYGNIFVVDSGYSTIRKLTSVGTNWVSSTIAGAPNQGSADGTNTAARFFNPGGVAVDSSGIVYVADSGNNTIRKLMPIGTNWVTSTIVGMPSGVGSEDGTNSEARFHSPIGIALNGTGNVFVADTGNNTIRRLTLVGTDWVSSTIGSVNSPRGVALDGAGNVYVTEPGSICELTLVGTNWSTRTIAGLADNYGSADGTNSDARFGFPAGITVDRAGNVYVADDNAIRKLTLVGTDWVTSTIAGLAGTGGFVDGTNSDARFNDPWGLATDSNGNIYVGDGFLSMVGLSPLRKLTRLGTNWVSSTIANIGGSAVTVDSADNVYVPAAGAIIELTPVGTNWVTSTIGGLVGRLGSADGTNSAARFNFGEDETGFAVDAVGNVFVADFGNNTIREGLPLAVSPSQPEFQIVSQVNGLLSLSWRATAGRTYQAQYNSDLTSTNWINVGATIIATNGTMTSSPSLGADRQRFYRIVLLPN